MRFDDGSGLMEKIAHPQRDRDILNEMRRLVTTTHLSAIYVGLLSIVPVAVLKDGLISFTTTRLPQDRGVDQ